MNAPKRQRLRNPGLGFLLSQLGGQSSRRWMTRLAAIGLEPREAMLFRDLALTEGRSQTDVARAIGLPASRIVAIVDRLETRGWIERRTSRDDRRTRSLYLTEAGRGILDQVATVSAEHEAELAGSLDPADRKRLIKFLRRLTADHGLIEGVHPGVADPSADQTSEDDR